MALHSPDLRPDSSACSMCLASASCRSRSAATRSSAAPGIHRAVGGPATQALVRRRAGDCVGVRGPFGTGWPLVEARGKDVLIVAGGIGLAPLRPAIYQVCGTGMTMRA